MKQLEPSTGKGIVELVGILEEVTGDLLVDWIEAEREIGGQHSRGVLLVRVESIRDDIARVLGHPLVGTSRRLFELPIELEEIFEIGVAELVRGLGPDDFQSGGNGVWALARAVLVLPSETLVLHGGSFGLSANVVRRSSTVGLAKAVTSSNQSNSFLVVHGHTTEGGSDVAGSGNRVWDTIRTLWVDVNQTHVGGSKRRFEIS
ncbi:uncharacterized protein PV06_02586 [Exophiala oligosperma]|uniref:Uncharacterized protein n=1 Tax=Exophiala oligosperma TaxID=215243 RepID=A0A0D2EGC3_9EURO|nr:uncharacterized protein PV06_02586 [Exophiala oligosperma]KIW46969.1 hypothetical protein PV06_02586 [Exophiala oligosperma]